MPTSTPMDHEPRHSRVTQQPHRSVARTAREIASHVISKEAEALLTLANRIDESFELAVSCILECTGHVICSGMGKSGLIMRKISATLASTGTPSCFLHPADALHGDVGMLARNDALIIASYSGTTNELLELLDIRPHPEVPVIALVGNMESPLARRADISLCAAVEREVCPMGLAPTTSSTVALALGDALAIAVLEARGFTREQFGRLHPRGRLGELSRVSLEGPAPSALASAPRAP